MEWQHQSSNTTGVFLEITEGRSLYFTPRETLIFGYLFDLADTDDDGLVGGADGGHAFLSRARLPPATLQRLWSEAGGGSPDACLARPQWFVLLALVGLAQADLPCTLRDLLDTCDAPVQQVVHGGPGRSAAASTRANGQVPHHQHDHHCQQHKNNETVHVQMPAQQTQHQQRQGHPQFRNQNHHQPKAEASSAGNAARPRPIPNFYLDGGNPTPVGFQQNPVELNSAGAAGHGTMEGEEGWSYAGGDGERGLGRYGGMGNEWEEVANIEDDEDQDCHLEVTVYSHRIVGEGYGSHTEYTVLANASVPRFARRELEVSRRFSDFRWLHGCFKALPGVLPPPLPPSKWAGSSSRDFVAERMKGLQRYMTRVAQHPVLRRQYALQVFLEGTPRGLRAAKALLPGGLATWGESFGTQPHGSTTISPGAPSSGQGMVFGSGTPVSPALSSSSGGTPPDEHAGFVRRRFALTGVDDTVIGTAGGIVVHGSNGNVRHGQRRSMSFGGSSDDGLSSGGGGAPGGGVMTTWNGGSSGTGNAGGLTSWPLSVVANVGYEAYGSYVASSLTSIKGVIGAVKTKARSVVGLGAGPAPISVEPDPVYDAEVAHVEELVTPVSGAVKMMESAAVLKRGVGYEMSRLGHYLTQVASLEDTDEVSPGDLSFASFGDEITGNSGRRHRGVIAETPSRSGTSGKTGCGAGLAKAEQVLGQRMEKVATAWLEAIDHEESDFLDPLREQLGYLSSAKEVHRGRVRALDALQAANASLQRNKQRLHAARAQGDAHAASVATGKMEMAEDRMASAHARAALISRTFKGEAMRFRDCRRTEGISAVLELARAQAAFARKANAAWKQVLEDINPTDEELRQSQERVQHPKREARIGEGKSRSGGSLAGWLPTTALSAAGVVGSGAGGQGRRGATPSTGGAESRGVVENCSSGHGDGIPGVKRGGVRNAGSGDVRLPGSGNTQGVSHDLRAEHRRDKRLPKGVRTGSGVESSGKVHPGGDLWADEEQRSQMAEVEARYHSLPPATVSTSLPFGDDWEALDRPPSGTTASAQDVNPDAQAQSLVLQAAGVGDDVGTVTLSTNIALASASPLTPDSKHVIGPSDGAKARSAGVMSSTASSAKARSRDGESISATSGAKTTGRTRRSSRRAPSKTGDGTGSRQMDSPSSVFPASPPKPSSSAKIKQAKGSSAAMSKASGDVTAPPTPSDAPRPSTVLSLMDSLEALSSSGGMDAPEAPAGRKRGEYKGERVEGLSDDPPGMTVIADRDALPVDVPGSGNAGKRPSLTSAASSSPSESKNVSASVTVDELGTSTVVGSESVVSAGSGSGSSSGSYGVAISAPTTVVRITGSPNPPARRGVKGRRSGESSDQSIVDTECGSRISASAVRRGGSGRVKSSS